MAPDATRGMLCAPIASRLPLATWPASGRTRLATLDQVLSCAAIGSPETVREELADFGRTEEGLP